MNKVSLSNLLVDKIVLITGASSGIGKSIAYDLSNYELKSLILISKDKSKLEESIANLKNLDCDLIPIVCNISDKLDVQKMGNIVLDRFGYIDILINNAGIGIFGKVESTSVEEIEQVNLTNYFGVIYCIKLFLKSMIKRNSGHIINIASLAASFGIPGMAAYCGSKFAVLGFSESLYYELKRSNVRISVISPIGVRTNFFNNRYFNNKIPLDYVLDPSDVSKAVLNALTSKKFQIFVPSISGLSIPIKHFLSPLLEFYIEKQFKKKLNY